jgi:Ribosomal protein L7/L12
MCNFDFNNYIDKISIFDLNKLTIELKNKFDFNVDLEETNLNTTENATEVASKPKFKVILSSVKSDKKISVLKTVKLLLGLGLKESKDLVEQTPSIIKQDIFLEEANELKTQIESAGGSVIIEKIA